MDFDWQDAVSPDAERQRRSGYLLALGHLLIAVAGVAVAAVTGHWGLILLVGVWMLGGIVVLVLLRRRLTRRGAPATDAQTPPAGRPDRTHHP